MPVSSKIIKYTSDHLSSLQCVWGCAMRYSYVLIRIDTMYSLHLSNMHLQLPHCDHQQIHLSMLVKSDDLYTWTSEMDVMIFMLKNISCFPSVLYFEQPFLSLFHCIDAHLGFLMLYMCLCNQSVCVTLTQQ